MHADSRDAGERDAGRQAAGRREAEFTDVLETPEEILDEPSYLSYTGRFWEAPDGEVYFRPWREFLLWPGQRGMVRLTGPDDALRIFNILKLRNVLGFTLLFMLLGCGLVLLATDAVAIANIWPDAALALTSLLLAFSVGLVPINLWCLLLFLRQNRRHRTDAKGHAGSVTSDGAR